MTPSEWQLQELGKLLAYSDRYEINIQFWPNQTAVYVSKDDVDLCDYGGDFDFAIGNALKWLNRVNRKPQPKINETTLL